MTDYIESPSDVVGYLRLVRECGDKSKPKELRQAKKRLFYTIEMSRRINRSAFRTSAMLLGETGAGKSSTINHLLNSNVVPVSDRESETRSVTEYTSVTESNDTVLEKGKEVEFNVSNLRFSLIDTPGLNDTAGENQDACNLWALKQFLKANCENINRGDNGRWIYPNIILLCFKATENRFDGENSRFVKNLKLLQMMGVIDSTKPNVVLVATFACSIPPRNWQQELTTRTENVKSVFRQKMGFDAPVVYLENDFEGYQLPADSEETGTVFTNGVVQPTNLYLAIMELLRQNQDELAYLTLRQLYRQGVTGQSFREDRSVQCKIAADNDLNDDEIECREALNINSQAAQRLKRQLDQAMERKAAELQIAEKQIQLALQRQTNQDPGHHSGGHSQSMVVNPASVYPYHRMAPEYGGYHQPMSFPVQGNSPQNYQGYLPYGHPQTSHDMHRNQSQPPPNIVNVSNNTAPTVINMSGRSSVVVNETPLPDRPEGGWSFKKLALGGLAFVGVGVAAVTMGPAIIAGAGSMIAAASSYIASGSTVIINFGGTVVNTIVGSVGTIEAAEIAPLVVTSLARTANYFR